MLRLTHKNPDTPNSIDNINGHTLGFYAHAGPRTSDFCRIFYADAKWRLEPQMVFQLYASG